MQNCSALKKIIRLYSYQVTRHRYTVTPGADKDRSLVAATAAAENNNGAEADVEMVMHGPSSVSSRAVRTSPA